MTLRNSALLLSLLAGASLIPSAAAWAEDAPEAAPPSAYHEPDSAEIVVTAPLNRSRFDSLTGATILQGTELTRDVRPTIGETLERQPGVSATSFGPNASRPVLRGFQGERIRVLTDGIGSIDVSNTSVDHAVIINPLLADRVEVLRGPQALLYGSSAIGGVVNVIDKRIPRKVPDEPVHIDALGNYGSAAEEISGAGSIDVPVGTMVVVHADGSYLDSSDLKIGGHVLSRDLRAQAAASSDPDIRTLSDLKGTLPNTASKTWQAALGASIIGDNGSNLGVSFAHYDSLYGVPIRYSLDPAEEAEAPRLDVVQNRLDVRAEVKTGGGLLDTIRFRGAYAHYRHFELEEDGSVGTAFYNDGYEGRLELVQAKRGGWHGVVGVQGFLRDFNVEGDEAFLPKNQTQQFGVFTLQDFDIGKLSAEIGARYEYSKLSAMTAAGDLRFFSGSRNFDALSASAGATYSLSDDWRLGVNLSRTVRAPSGEELFANGGHAGTEAYELGNPDFAKEKSWGVEAVLRGKGPGYTFEASAFHNWISDYIYEVQTAQSVCEAAAAPSGRTVDLPCFQSLQAKARYYGVEAEGTLRLASLGSVNIVADALGDYVRAQVVGVGPAPRIPALRVLGGLEAQSELADGRVEAEWVDSQKRVTGFETPTGSYALVNASLAIRPWGRGGIASFVLSANNILDTNARRHASFLADYAPLAGRDFRVSARMTF